MNLELSRENQADVVLNPPLLKEWSKANLGWFLLVHLAVED